MGESCQTQTATEWAKLSKIFEYSQFYIVFAVVAGVVLDIVRHAGALFSQMLSWFSVSWLSSNLLVANIDVGYHPHESSMAFHDSTWSLGPVMMCFRLK